MSRSSLLALSLLLLPAAESVANDVTLEVLDEGRATGRRSLRLALADGRQWRMHVTCKMAMEMRPDGGPPSPMPVPVIDMDSVIKVLDVDASGAARLEMRMQGMQATPGPESPAGTKQAIEHAARDLNKVSGRFTMNDRGLLSDVRFGFEGDGKIPLPLQLMVDSMHQSLQQSLIPFPVEPVGIGAKWRMALKATVSGMTQTVTTTYTLTELAADRLALRSEIEQAAEPQALQLPGVPPGTRVRLEALSGAGPGEVELELDRPVPVQSAIRMKTDMRMTFGGAPGESLAVSQTVDVDTRISSAPVTADVDTPAGAAP